MKFKVVICLCVVLAAGVVGLFVACAKPASQNNEATTSIQRGKYLVTVMACGDCHTPKKMGPNGPEQDITKFLSGYVGDGKVTPPSLSGAWLAATNSDQTAWAGPWGVSFSRNLTPDEDTGIGSWSEETFVKAIRTGRHMGVSRAILPPMPWEAIGHLTDSDLRAIYAYLRTIPPIHNPTPDPVAPAQAPAH